MKGLAELVAEAVMTPAAAPQIPSTPLRGKALVVGPVYDTQPTGDPKLLEGVPPRDVYYRYDGRSFAAPTNEWGETISGSRGPTEVRLGEYDVMRRTEKGAWIYTGEYDGCRPKGLEGCRFILTDARKRWACPSEEEARASFIARKRRQAGILRARAEQAELELLIAERGEFDTYIYPHDEFRMKVGGRHGGG